jgi:hypothetical protein
MYSVVGKYTLQQIYYMSENVTGLVVLRATHLSIKLTKM